MNKGKAYFVYCLLSLKDYKFYLGFTNDIKRRLKQHNLGKNLSTKSRRPFKLVYFEFHLSKRDAIRRENYFKTKSGKRTIRLMIRETLKQYDIGLQ